MAKIYKHKFGTEEFPVPIADKITGKITWLASEEDAIYIPTMRDEPKEAVYGRLIRNVVTDPTMMKDMTEMLLRLDKGRTPEESKSYGYTTMGAPGNGKTYLTKAIGALVHPKGALVVDCNNIDNPDELYKVTTFSVDETRKQRKIDARVKMGNIDPEQALSQNAVAYMKKMFGNDVVTQETRDGKRITAIDWNAVKGDSAFVEGVIDKVMEMENIPYEKDHSSLGFVVSNGPLLRALVDPDSPDYGRMVIRDESNRGPVVDAWLKIEAFFSEPGADELKLKGEDDKEFTIKRSEIPETFMFLGTANQATEDMGSSAKELTKPMISRQGMGIDIRQIADAEKADYLSRTLKHLTGVPAYHVYMMDPETFDRNPEQLAETLMYFRTVGLTPEEKKKIPQEELFNIRHIDRTIKVATQYGALLSEAENIITKAAKDETLPERYTSYLENQAVVDLRYVFKLYQHAKIDQPRGKSSGAGIFSKLGRAVKPQTQEEVAWELNKRIARREKEQLLVRGTRLENEVAVKLKDMIIPDSINSLLRDSEDRKADYEKIEGLWKSLQQTAKGLNFEFAGYVGEDSVAKTYNARPEDLPSVALDEIKEVLIASIREEYKDELQGQKLSAEDVFDDNTLLEATQMLARENEGQSIFVPNYDLETTAEKPLKQVYMAPVHGEGARIDRESLINANQFADSFIIKSMRSHNIKKYAKEAPHLDVDAYLEELAQYGEDCVNNGKMSCEIASDKNDAFFTTVVFVNDRENQKTGVARIVYNKANQNTLILADFDVSDDDKAKLSKSGVFYVNLNEVNKTGEYEIIGNYLSKQTMMHEGVTNAHVVSSLMLRIDTEMGMGSSGDENAVEFCYFLQNMGENEKQNIDALQLTNVEYEKGLPVKAALNKKLNGR